MPKQNDIWVVVVTHNAEKWIANCLDSIFKSTIPASVIVVDNNSRDHTVPILNKDYPTCVLLKNKENKGFGFANNIGISYALEHGAEFVTLLNQDAKLHPETLEKLMGYAGKYPEYGILAPMFYSYDGLELDEFLLKWTYHYDVSLASDIFFQRAREVYQVPLMPAAMWLMKRRAIEEAGLFDPLFFMYKEDDDLWRRLQWKGWKTGFFPNAVVYHHTSKENSYTVQKRIWHTYGNMILHLKNCNRSFIRCLLTLLREHVARSISALAFLNHSELYVLNVSFFSVCSRMFKIYQNRQACIKEKGVFILKSISNETSDSYNSG